jgi:hypothetical protein
MDSFNILVQPLLQGGGDWLQILMTTFLTAKLPTFSINNHKLLDSSIFFYLVPPMECQLFPLDSAICVLLSLTAAACSSPNTPNPTCCAVLAVSRTNRIPCDTLTHA